MSTATALITQPLAGPFGAKAGKPGCRYKTDSGGSFAAAAAMCAPCLRGRRHKRQHPALGGFAWQREAIKPQLVFLGWQYL